MKKSRIFFALLCAITISLPLHAADTQIEQSVSFSDRLRSLQSKATQSLKSARSILQQKGSCLINYESCTSRDKIAISTAFGFMMGYGIRVHLLIDRLLEKVGVQTKQEFTSPHITRDTFITIVAALMAEEVGLTGPLFMQKFEGVPGMFTAGLLQSGNKKTWFAGLKNLITQSGPLNKSLFIVVIAIEAFVILQEALYAVKFEQKSPMIAIAGYLKMNAKCIWDEKHCKPTKSAEERRLGLYFWLGYLQGHAARELKKQFFNY